MRKVVNIILALMMVLNGLFIKLVIYSPIVRAYTLHDTIIIFGDDDFTLQAANESWPGDGTEGNPFIINGLEINASTEISIGIWNTSVHFVISDSMILGFRRGSKGIYLNNVSNGRIDNCTVKTTRNAIEIVNSSEIQMTGNNITDNYWRGILLTNSNNNMIVNNNISHTESRGIYLDHSNNNHIINNSISKNSARGLVLSFSRGNILKNNTFFKCGLFIEGRELEDWSSHEIDDTNILDEKSIYFLKNQVGGTIPPDAGQIFLVNCSELKINNQEINETYISIHLVYSSKNVISNNYALFNEYSLYLYHSNENTIENNIASNGGFGIYLDSSSNNHIKNNTISNNYWGLYLNSNSNNNKVFSNLFNGNWMPGILISYSNGTTLSNNMMMFCGIEVEGNQLEHWISQNIDISNTVDGRPVHYLKDQSGGMVPANAGQVFLINCTNVRVENQMMTELSQGISMAYSSNNIIIKNTVTKCIKGISLSYSNYNYLENNNVYSNSDGFSFHRSNNNTIVNNSVKNNSIGIYLYQSNDNNMWNNTALNNNNQAIGIYYSNQNYLYDNNLSQNNDGIVVWHSDKNLFYNNDIKFNDQSGFRIRYSNETELLNNKISNNVWYGIELDESFRMIIIANNISNNRYGFSFRNSDDSIIHHNNIVNNTIRKNTFYSSNKWHNGAGEGNYWSDYEGLDDGSDYAGTEFPRVAGDGIGDTDLPHHRVDRYPLMEPVDITRQYEVWIDDNTLSEEDIETEIEKYYFIVMAIVIIAIIILILLIIRSKKSEESPSKNEMLGSQSELEHNENQSLPQNVAELKIMEQPPKIGREE